MDDMLITGGLFSDGSGPWDIAVADGKIRAVLPAGATTAAREHIDARGLRVLPGLVDAHVHSRDPGYSHKEEFATLTRAAASGGITTVMAMPNTNPPLTTPAGLRYARDYMGGKNLVDVHLVAGACMGMPALIPSLAEAGAIALDVYDNPYAHGSGRWVELFEQAGRTGLPLCFYLFDLILEARNRRALDKTPLPTAEKLARTSNGLTECIAIGRLFPLAAYFGVPVVLRMLTTADGVDCVRWMRRQFPDAKVSVEVNIHYLFLTSDDLTAMGAAAYMHPPLRSARDVEALWSAVADGTVDFISTDHAPHAPEEKNRGSLGDGPSGIIGLETMLPLLLDASAKGRLALSDIERLCCENPARIFGLHPRKGTLAPGADADITLVDPKAAWRIDAGHFYSKGEKGPFDGREVIGRPRLTLVGGKKVAEDGRIL